MDNFGLFQWFKDGNVGRLIEGTDLAIISTTPKDDRFSHYLLRGTNMPPGTSEAAPLPVHMASNSFRTGKGSVRAWSCIMGRLLTW
jgi:hypothetical protein